jgi:hypothetical protein
VPAVLFALGVAQTGMTGAGKTGVRAVALVLGMAGIPLVAQHEVHACLATAFITLVPLPGVPAVPQIALKFVRALLVTLLSAGGYYYELAPTAAARPAAAEHSCIAWVWVAWAAWSPGFLQHEAGARALWAHSEALAAAETAAAGVLKSLLPPLIIERLTAGTAVEALTTTDADVALLFADVVGFTALCAQSALRNTSPQRIFDLINAVFIAFERAAAAHGAFKVKSVGDCIIVSRLGTQARPSPQPKR